MPKFFLLLALALAAVATVPASAGPYCQEDLGYGRTSSFASVSLGSDQKGRADASGIDAHAPVAERFV